MTKNLKGAPAPAPAPTYSIELFQDADRFWVGHFLKDGKSIFDTGIPNSFAYVYARLEPWFAQAPNTVVAK